MSINQISILMLIPPMLLAALIIVGVASHFMRAFVVGIFKGVGEHRTIPGQKLTTSVKAVPRELILAGREFRAATVRVSMEFRVPRPNRPSIVEASRIAPSTPVKPAPAATSVKSEPAVHGRPSEASPSIISSI